MNEIVTTFECECNPNKIYASRYTFQQHFTSMRHKNWQNNQTIRYLREKSVRFENRYLQSQRNYLQLKTTFINVLNTVIHSTADRDFARFHLEQLQNQT